MAQMDNAAMAARRKNRDFIHNLVLKKNHHPEPTREGFGRGVLRAGSCASTLSTTVQKYSQRSTLYLRVM
jgi:hypothetical protein